MEKIVKDYIKPWIKVNDFISRHQLLAGWELGEGTTNDQFSHDDEVPDELDPNEPNPGFRNNVWGQQ